MNLSSRKEIDLKNVLGFGKLYQKNANIFGNRMEIFM